MGVLSFMNPPGKALWMAVVSACLGLPATIAYGGIIDDSANDADHLALAAQSQYDPVGVVKRLNNQSQLVVDSSGILIAPDWVLTAAHTIPSGNPQPTDTWTFGSEVRHIDQAIRHPSYGGDIANGFDLALHKLDAPITSITPASLYTGSAASLVGQTLTYVGFGRTGTGSTGDTQPAGAKRAGLNEADQAGYTLNPGPSQTVYSSNIIFADMDDPPGGIPYGNPLGSSMPINLEYLIALGDSGGGLFVEDNGEFFLAGVHSVLIDFDPTGTIGYGDVMGSTTIAAALTWINNTIAPPPVIGDLNGDGFVGIDDLNIILSNWNQSVTPGSLLDGDPSNDGFVGIDDLNTVLGNWNAGTPPNLNQLDGLVPEPGTATAFGIIFTGLVYRRTRRG